MPSASDSTAVAVNAGRRAISRAAYFRSDPRFAMNSYTREIGNGYEALLSAGLRVSAASRQGDWHGLITPLRVKAAPSMPDRPPWLSRGTTVTGFWTTFSESAQ